jgi:hypothetical protein
VVNRRVSILDGRARAAAFVLALLGAGLAGSGAAPAVAGDSGFLSAERSVLGGEASGGWRSVLFGGSERALADEGGAVPGEFAAERRVKKSEGSAPTSGKLGRKLKAGALSAILPGAGQFYNGRRNRAYLMAGVEVGIWTTYIVFDTYGDNRMESAREWAGIYAGASGNHSDGYWQNVGQYESSDDYNDARRREARALQEEISGLVGPDGAWQWVNEDRQNGYLRLRNQGSSAYTRRDFMILFAVVNRAISVFDAVVGAGRVGDATHARVLGMDIELQLDPAATDPGARCVVSRGF